MRQLKKHRKTASQFETQEAKEIMKKVRCITGDAEYVADVIETHLNDNEEIIHINSTYTRRGLDLVPVIVAVLVKEIE